MVKTKVRLAAVVLTIVFLGLLVLAGNRLAYQIVDEQIRISWIRPVVIPLPEVIAVEILDGTVRMRRDFGIGVGNLRQGTFTVEGVGRVRMYAGDIRRPLVLIHTESAIYGVTPTDASEFKRLAGF